MGSALPWAICIVLVALVLWLAFDDPVADIYGDDELDEDPRARFKDPWGER